MDETKIEEAYKLNTRNTHRNRELTLDFNIDNDNFKLDSFIYVLKQQLSKILPS